MNFALNGIHIIVCVNSRILSKNITRFLFKVELTFSVNSLQQTILLKFNPIIIKYALFSIYLDPIIIVCLSQFVLLEK